MILQSLYPPVTIELPHTNAHNFLFPPDAVNSEPNFVMHIDGLTGEERTRKQVLERLYDGATALTTPESDGGLGISRDNGEIVAIQSHNSLEFYILVHSLIRRGIPVACFSAYATPIELLHTMRVSRCTRLFVAPEFLSAAEKAAKELGISTDRVYLLEGSAPGKKSLGELINHVRRNNIPRAPVQDVKKTDILYIVMSSGTTGLPKAVAISHANLRYTLMQIATMAQAEDAPPSTIDNPVVFLTLLPMFHVAGLQTTCLRGILGEPTRYVFLPKWDLEKVVELIPKYRVTLVPSVPSMLHGLANYKGKQKLDLSTVKDIACGAAHVPAALVAQLKPLMAEGATFTELYGQSEITFSCIWQPPAPPHPMGHLRHPDSLGILAPGVVARIVRDDGTDADYDEPGELFVRTESAALGYLGNDKATRETFLDDMWVKTGDVMKVDRQGRFYYVDRIKDTLKLAGMQVSPTEVEDIILMHPEKLLLDICVAGVKGTRLDEKNLRAWIVLSEEGKKQGQKTVTAKLEKWVGENLSMYKRMRGGWEVVSEIPKTATGKPLRRELIARYEAEMKGGAKSKL